MEKILRLAFVSSAFNEEKNLETLYRRCRYAYEKVQEECKDFVEVKFRFIIADNGSKDDSAIVMKRLCQEDSGVKLLINNQNYGPEASVANALKVANDCDLVVILCSDLQDPPELAITMILCLVMQGSHDAVIGVKERSAGNSLLVIARRAYYRLLRFSTRLHNVPGGFHGFGCYRQEVIEEALSYWEKTDLNLRQCLANACMSPMQISYRQADRAHGISSYKRWGYWSEALRSLASGDASASRFALLIGSGGMLLGIIVALLLVINYLRGNSGYSGGIPTVMALIILSFTLQMLMFGLLSRQMEALRMGGVRPKVRFRLVRSSYNSARDRATLVEELDEH